MDTVKLTVQELVELIGLKKAKKRTTNSATTTCIATSCRTSAPGLFATGDVTDNYAEQVLIAVGEGAKAALSAYEYLLPKL